MRHEGALKEAYVKLYRIPDHNYLAKRCRDERVKTAPEPVKLFAQRLLTLKRKRALADYDPLERFEISSVQAEVGQVEQLFQSLEAMEESELFEFAIFSSLPDRKAN